MGAGRPGPLDQRIVRHVMLQLIECAVAICIRIFDSFAELASVESFPSHAQRCKAPVRCAGNAACLLISIGMAGAALKSGGAVVRIAPLDVEAVRMSVIALSRKVRRRMAVDATWIREYGSNRFEVLRDDVSFATGDGTARGGNEHCADYCAGNSSPHAASAAALIAARIRR
jgi:hypothetical protein